MNTTALQRDRSKGEIVSTFLLDEVRRLHPGLAFCGEPRNALSQVSDELLNYVLSALRNVPVSPPRASTGEWLHLLSVLTHHFLVPTFYWHCCLLPHEFLPPEEIFNEMRKEFVWSRARTLFMDRQLHEILAAFEREGIRVLVLKGPALARSAYPHSAMRLSSDIDLLVPPEDMARSRIVLEGLGYKCLWKLFEVFKEYYYNEGYIHRKQSGDKRGVELHWDLHPFLGIRREVGVRELFRGAVKIESPSLTFWALNPIDALIHRAVNNAFVHDREIRLSWIYDVAVLARSLVPPDDWEVLQERSVDWRARVALEVALKMAQVWVGLQLPPGFKDFSTWPQPTEVEAEVWPHVVRRHNKLTSLLKLRVPNPSGHWKKVGFLFRAVFPPPDHMRKVYGPSNGWMLPLTYGRRLWKGVFRFFSEL